MPDAGGERPPAMTDVARAASVSHQTVSRVLNGHPNVRPATPNLAARALATGRSTALGLVTLNTTLFGPVATLYAVEQAARDAGYSVSVASVRAIDRMSLTDAVERLVRQGVAGLVVIAPIATSDSAMSVLPADLPAVVVEADAEPSVSAVTVDQAEGAYLATRHLLELGHRTVVHVRGPDEWIEARQRVAGWRRALEEVGAPVPQLISGDWSAQSGYDAGAVLARTPEVTAVFAANDNMALGLLRALSEQGRSVPGDVSVVGFDDVAEAAFFTPPLTSIRQDFAEMGRRSVELLLRRVDGAATRIEHIMLAPELVVRDSAAPPPA
jgi:DNA-binding LacI/PurR family transcriptional regulator